MVQVTVVIKQTQGTEKSKELQCAWQGIHLHKTLTNEINELPLETVGEMQENPVNFPDRIDEIPCQLDENAPADKGRYEMRKLPKAIMNDFRYFQFVHQIRCVFQVDFLLTIRNVIDGDQKRCCLTIIRVCRHQGVFNAGVEFFNEETQQFDVKQHVHA